MSRVRDFTARRLREEGGWTLTELLVTITLMIVVLGATLTSLDTFTTNSRLNTKQNDAQDKARASLEQVARQLRNLAVPTGNATSIDLAGRNELIFKTADPTRKRVRYCLNDSVNGASAGNERIVRQVQASGDTSTALPAAASTGCPSTWPNWDSTTGFTVTDNVVNNVSGIRPLFSYACTGGCPSGTPVGDAPTDLSKVTEIRAEIFVDVNKSSERPNENRIATGIYLRNQNQKPLASWTSRTGTGPNTVVFNGSDSSDAENRTLVFFWFSGESAADRTAVATDPKSPGLACTVARHCIGVGVTLTYQFPSSASTGVTLLVRDPGGLTDFLPKTCNPATGVCS